MARSTKSIPELRRELEARQRELDRLVSSREKLAAQLADLDSRIAALGGQPAAAPTRRRRRKAAKKAAGRRGPRKAAATKASAPRAGRRGAGKPLSGWLVDVLKKADGPMRIKDVVASVRAAGYESSAKDFYGIVAAALRGDDRFEKVARGLYKLA